MGGNRTVSRGRRQFLTGLAGSCTVAVAGCISAGQNTVSVLAAGSLAHTFEDYIGPAFESETNLAMHGEYFGSNAVMRMVEDETKYPDVIVSADATLLRDRLYDEYIDWDVEFATNSLGVGYNPSTELGQQLDTDEPWYEVLPASDSGDVTIGDPDLDPLGYRAIQAFQLAEEKHDLDGFRETMRSLTDREPDEPAMMAGVTSGSRAASIVYKNMAVDHDMPFVEFPDAYNFADPALTDHYAQATYTTDEEEYTAEGRPILYNATVRSDASTPAAGRQFIEFMIDNPDLLDQAGLTVPDSVPRGHGAVPAVIDL